MKHNTNDSGIWLRAPKMTRAQNGLQSKGKDAGDLIERDETLVLNDARCYGGRTCIA